MRTANSFTLLALLIVSISGHRYSESPLYTDVSSMNLPTVAVTGPTMDMEAGDLDGDGDLDIVLAREFAPNKILFNNGGVFTDGTSGNLPQFSYDSEDIGLADFDGDDDMDIVFASEDNAVHELYLNNGNGSFRNANNRMPNSIANAVLARDVNNDGRPDMILGNAGQDFLLINNGDTTFTDETALRLPSSGDITQDMKLADIDDDGDNDLILGNEDGNKIYINDGNGFFGDETSLRLPPSSVEETRKVTLGDIDGDKDLDIFFANVAFRPGMSRQDRLLINNGVGVFLDATATNLPPDNEHTTEGIFIDFDYDGDIDLITSNIFFNRPMKAFQNNGSGVFTEVTNEVFPPNVVAEGIGVSIFDLNGDGLNDIYLANRRSAQQTTETDRLLLRNDTSTTSAGSQIGTIPANISISQNYPNPFNPSTKFRITVNKPQNVTVELFDVSGKKIMNLFSGSLAAGEFEIQFNSGELNSGVYYYSLKLEDGNVLPAGKMVLMK